MKKLYLFLVAILIMACQKAERPLSMYVTELVRVESKISFTLKVQSGEVPIHVIIHINNTNTGLIDKEYILNTKAPVNFVFSNAAIKSTTKIFIYYRNENTDTKVINL